VGSTTGTPFLTSPRACGEHAGDKRELGVEVLGVGWAKLVATAPAGPPVARAQVGVALRITAEGGCGRSELSHDCGAPPPAAAHTRCHTETHGFGPGLRSVAKASLEPVSGLAGLALPADQSLALPGEVSPADVGVETLGPRCARLALQPFRAHPRLLSTGGPGRPRPEGGSQFSWDGCSGGVSLSRCRRPPLPSLRDLGPELDVGSPRPITAPLTPVLAG
jgi:hypothetical protein